MSNFSLIPQAYAQGFGPQEWQEGTCMRDGVATLQGVQCLIGNVLSIALTLLGLLAFVMFIYAAFKYMLAGSNSKNVDSARSTMTFAIIGIVVAISAYMILRLLTLFTGINLLDFVIPSSNTTY